jgi:2-polyprenyl-3-methyl-5-hydroxy-6-metoxy-1,4-benzoquinol methylase
VGRPPLFFKYRLLRGVFLMLDFLVCFSKTSRPIQFINKNMFADTNQIRTIPRITCPLCGGGGKLLHSHLKDRMFGISGYWSLQSCNQADCGTCWLDPAPLDADIGLLYKTYNTHRQENPRQVFLAVLRLWLYRGYIAVTCLPSAILGLGKARCQILHMFLEDLPPGRVLDVGCGDGGFLHRMQRLGWSSTGVDFDPKAIENAHARYGSTLTLLNTDLSHAHFPDDFFDVVTMSHVIEHVPDPVALLVEARRVLKSGGRLVVTTPNIQSFGHEKFRDCWWGLDAPRHLQIFTLAALKLCARKASFTVVEATSSAANADTFIGGSFGFVAAKELDKGDSGSRVEFNFLRGLRSLLLQYREAWLLRHNPECGEEAVLICQK